MLSDEKLPSSGAAGYPTLNALMQLDKDDDSHPMQNIENLCGAQDHHNAPAEQVKKQFGNEQTNQLISSAAAKPLTVNESEKKPVIVLNTKMLTVAPSFNKTSRGARGLLRRLQKLRKFRRGEVVLEAAVQCREPCQCVDCTSLAFLGCSISKQTAAVKC